jgi:hypothetical protein
MDLSIVSLIKKFPSFLGFSEETRYDWAKIPEEIKWPLVKNNFDLKFSTF